MSYRVMLKCSGDDAKGRKGRHQVHFIIKLGLNRLLRIYASFDVTSRNIFTVKVLCMFVEKEDEKSIISCQLRTTLFSLALDD